MAKAPAATSQGREAGAKLFSGLTSRSVVMWQANVEWMVMMLASLVSVQPPRCCSADPPRIPHAGYAETCPTAPPVPNRKHLRHTEYSGHAPLSPGGKRRR